MVQREVVVVVGGVLGRYLRGEGTSGEESGAWLASDGVTATKTTVLTRFRSP